MKIPLHSIWEILGGGGSGPLAHLFQLEFRWQLRCVLSCTISNENFGSSKVSLTYFSLPNSTLLFSEVFALNWSCFSMKVKYKREELGDVYFPNLATSALRAIGLHLVSNDIVRKLYILSVLYYR